MANIPAEYDITIRKGDDFKEVYEIRDSDGDIVDLTGWSGKAQIRTKRKRSATLIAEFTVTIPSPANGRVHIALSDTVTGAISKSTGFWDLLMTDPDSFDETYISAEVAFEETVTDLTSPTGTGPTGTGPTGGSDADAIHDNIAGEIANIAEKEAYANDDVVAMENSASAWGKNRYALGNILGKYLTVAHAKAAEGFDTRMIYVIATETYYRYEADGAGYTADDLHVLATGDGGDTRWIGVAGNFVYGGISIGSVGMNFNNLRAIAMVCDNDTAANMPNTGNETAGQWWLANDIGVLFVHNGTRFMPIIGLLAFSLYVDSSNGTDAPGKGFSSGTGAVATWAYLLDLIPGKYIGDISIYLSGENFNEAMPIQGKSAGGDAGIYIYGTKSTVMGPNTVDSAVQGTGATQGSITDTGAFAAYITSTTVDQDSAAETTTLYVTATTNMTAGKRVIIDPAGTGGGTEAHRILSVNAGVSIEVDGVLEYTHTAAAGDTVLVCELADKMAWSSSGGEIRLIDWHTSDKIVVAGTWDTTPAGTYTVYDWATQFTKLEIKTEQKNVYIFDIKYEGHYSYMSAFTSLTATRVCFTATQLYALYALDGEYTLTANQCLLYVPNDGGYAFRALLGGQATFDGCIFNGKYTGNTGAVPGTGGKVNIQYGSIVEGFDVYGMNVPPLSYGSMWSSAAKGYTRVRNCNTGIYQQAGGATFIPTVQYAGNVTDYNLN